MSELADFLLARILEDEALAREASSPDTPALWFDSPAGDSPVWAYINRFGADRTLAECEAKRRIVAAAQAANGEPQSGIWPPRVHMTGMADGLRMALGYLALPYADHPDYDQAWRTQRTEAR